MHSSPWARLLFVILSVTLLVDQTGGELFPNLEQNGFVCYACIQYRLYDQPVIDRSAFVLTGEGSPKHCSGYNSSDFSYPIACATDFRRSCTSGGYTDDSIDSVCLLSSENQTVVKNCTDLSTGFVQHGSTARCVCKKDKCNGQLPLLPSDFKDICHPTNPLEPESGTSSPESSGKSGSFGYPDTSSYLIQMGLMVTTLALF